MKENQQERMFKSLIEIVNYYTNQKMLTKPYTSTLSRESWFAGDLTGEEGEIDLLHYSLPSADELLSSQKPGTFLIRFSSQPGSCLCTNLIPRILCCLVY